MRVIALFCLLLSNVYANAWAANHENVTEEQAKLIQLEALAEQKPNAATLWNAALAHSTSGNLAWSKWYLMRALLFEPSNEMFLAKLSQLNQDLNIERDVVGSRSWPFLRFVTLLQALLAACLCSWGLYGVLLCRKKLPKLALPLACFATSLAMAQVFAKYSHEKLRPNCVMVAGAKLRAAPSQVADSLGDIRLGEVHVSVRKHSSFLKVRTLSGRQAYVDKAKCLIVKKS